MKSSSTSVMPTMIPLVDRSIRSTAVGAEPTISPAFTSIRVDPDEQKVEVVARSEVLCISNSSYSDRATTCRLQTDFFLLTPLLLSERPPCWNSSQTLLVLLFPSSPFYFFVFVTTLFLYSTMYTEHICSFELNRGNSHGW